MTDDEFYDDEIAPTLLHLAGRCRERQLGLFALVQLDRRGGCGRTVALPPDVPALLRYCNALADSMKGNGDLGIGSLILGGRRSARTSGDNAAPAAPSEIARRQLVHTLDRHAHGDFLMQEAQCTMAQRMAIIADLRAEVASLRRALGLHSRPRSGET